MLAVRRIIDQKFMLFFAFYKAIHNPVYFIQGDEGVFSPLYGVVDFVGRSEGSVLIPHSVHHRSRDWTRSWFHFMLLLANFYGGTLGREIRIVNNYEAPSSVANSLAMDLIGHVSRVVNLHDLCEEYVCSELLPLKFDNWYFST